MFDQSQTQTKETIMPRLVVLYGNGEYRVHAEGCRDVKRDAERLGDTPFANFFTTYEELREDMWADIASDNETPGTQAHTDLMQSYMDNESDILPCVKWEAS